MAQQPVTDFVKIEAIVDSAEFPYTLSKKKHTHTIR